MADPKGPPPIVIKDWAAGIGPSPFVGFGDMRGVAVDEKTGALLVNFKSSKESGTTITGLPRYVVVNPSNGDLYLLDDDGKLYKSSDDGDSWALITGNTLPSAGNGGAGLGLWKGYVFVFRGDTNLDVYSIAGGTWTNGWKTVQDVDFHHAIITPDDKLTFGNGRYVATIQETASSTFDPGNSATYTYTADKLDLPAQYTVKCLEMLGLDLKIGTFVGSSPNDTKVADIFSWDRVSPSFTGSKTINIAENGVHAMKTVRGRMYVVAGAKGNVYVTNGTDTILFKEFKSVDFASTAGSSVVPLPGAVMAHNDKLYVGIGGGAGSTPHGVFSVHTVTGAVVMEGIISSGSVAAAVKIGALYSVSGETYIVGWQDATAQGADLVGNGNLRYASYAAYVDSPLYRVGTSKRKRSFSEVEFVLGRDLVSGQGVRISWRGALNDSFSSPVTFDFATHAGIPSAILDLPISDVENVQFRIELTTNGNVVTTPELLEVVVR